MSKLKGLLLTEGLHGMISQVEGLAKALDLDYFHEKVELNSFWKLIPPRFTPIKKFVFKNNINKDFNIIISCGRKSVVPSIFLKKINSKIKNIHIQDPKVNFKNFDYIISPEHDNLKGDNIISSKGAIHYLTSEEIDEKKNYLLERISKEKKIITLILGGPTKYYAYSNQNLLNIFSKISKQVLNNNFQVIVIPSNRTPVKTIELAKKFFSTEHLIIDKVDKDAYLSSLGISDFIIVTCDSSSMISEAALTGKPLYVAMIPPSKKDTRFQKFRKLFERMNIIREFDDKLEVWDYEKLDETKRIAYEIKKKL
ncbi:mitochondrial fission ELM1 family protein [Candidatus Pelagibacter sp.]|nr:mitochondrial fission ELM1 family protein [Candidatus Pelagibacter sp.]|tara:strand:+ start:16 stop:948 length:933 start_codon:yes stop_codon:yes gene_type:complete